MISSQMTLTVIQIKQEDKIMKKNIFKSAFLLAIIGGFAAACNVEPVPSQPEADAAVTSLELCASLPSAQTKTSLGSDYKVLWSAGDQISVNGVLSNAVADEDHGSAEVRFRVEGNLAAPFKVLYPGTTSANVITLPATQNYVADNYDAAAYAAYGKVEQVDGEYTATLNNFCGLVRFALNGSATLTKIEVNALGGEKLHGAFTLADAFDGTFTGGTAGSLTYSFGEGLKLSVTDTYVYIALPAQTYAAGVEAKVYQADGAFMRLKFWGDGEVLAGSELRDFASKTYAAGRTENLVGIGDLVAEDGGMPSVQAGVKVALFNILRFDEDYRPNSAITKTDSDKAYWRPEGAIVTSNADMRATLGKVIYNTQADVIGFNEIDDAMNGSGKANSIEDMAKAQGCNYTFKFFSSGASGWFSSGESKFANGFAYNPDVVELLSSGRYWYDKNATKNYNKTSDNNSGSPKNTFVWAQFKHKDSGKKFWFFVAHLPTKDHESPEDNTKAANGINNLAKDMAGSAPQILVGDMNNADVESHACYNGAMKLLDYWSDVYNTLDDSGNLPSFYKTYSGTQSGTGKNYQYSILDFCKSHPERRIDKIYTYGPCEPTSYKTVRNTYTVHYTGEGTDKDGEVHEVDEDVACYPSDHLAVVYDVTLD